MPLFVRLLVVLFAVSLGACASRSPTSYSQSVSTVWAPSSTDTLNLAPEASEVLLRAIALVGTPYRWGGNTPESGFDCSGLIGYVYRSVGVSLPRTASELSRLQASNIDRQSLRAGDLVFFATQGNRQVSHVGIYVGEGRFVHAPAAGGTVHLSQLSQAYWNSSYLGAKRVLSGGGMGAVSLNTLPKTAASPL